MKDNPFSGQNGGAGIALLLLLGVGVVVLMAGSKQQQPPAGAQVPPTRIDFSGLHIGTT